MEETDLTDQTLWESTVPLVLQNPRVLLPAPPAEMLPAGALLFATSGSTGIPKWILHTRETILTAAAGANRHLQAEKADVWLRCLPEFHVGGFSIAARARLTGSRVVAAEGKWSAAEFVRILAGAGVTLTALVPAQVHDLAMEKLVAPPGLRAVVVGGGRLSESVAAAAADLGWPLRPSYGLTEAGSQVATATQADSRLHLLNHWEAATDVDGRLLLRGAALFRGAFFLEANAWQFREQPPGSWFATADRVRLENRVLHWLGRMDRTMKILGELVDLDALERELSALAGAEVAVVTLPDARRGHVLAACAEIDLDPAIAIHHQRCAPFARLGHFLQVEELPRSPLGKIQRAELETLARARWGGR